MSFNDSTVCLVGVAIGPPCPDATFPPACPKSCCACRRVFGPARLGIVLPDLSLPCPRPLSSTAARTAADATCSGPAYAGLHAVALSKHRPRQLWIEMTLALSSLLPDTFVRTQRCTGGGPGHGANYRNWNQGSQDPADDCTGGDVYDKLNGRTGLNHLLPAPIGHNTLLEQHGSSVLNLVELAPKPSPGQFSCGAFQFINS